MRVLVCVDMRKTQATALEEGNLRCNFGFDFGGADAAGEETQQEDCERVGEAAGSRFDEGGNLVWRERRIAIDQDDVASNAERGSGTGDLDGFIYGGSSRHERGAGEDS